MFPRRLIKGGNDTFDIWKRMSGLVPPTLTPADIFSAKLKNEFKKITSEFAKEMADSKSVNDHQRRSSLLAEREPFHVLCTAAILNGKRKISFLLNKSLMPWNSIRNGKNDLVKNFKWNLVWMQLLGIKSIQHLGESKKRRKIIFCRT